MSLVSELKSFELFKASSPDFLSELSLVASKKSATKGQKLISEGVLNDQLMILASGHVHVQVNGERVADLTQPGDLMGEISVLAGRKATASLVAATDVEFFSIPARSLDRSVEFGFELYRLFTAVLSDKIIKTNEKARRFEISHRSLVDINRTLDQKVQERTETTFKRLGELKVALTEKNTDLALEILKPINEMFSTDRSMRSRRVLVAEPDRKQQTIAKMALGGTGARLEMASTREEVIGALKTNSASSSLPDLIFVCETMAPLIPEIRDLAPDAKLVYMAGNELMTGSEDLKRAAPLLSNIISRNTENRSFTVKNMATTVTKLFSKDLFGFEKYMMWGVEAQSHAVTHSSERSSLISTMEEHLKNLGVRSKITEKAAAVAEELLMNAIYDAPSKDGVHHYAHLPRTTAVQLEPSEYGEFRYACDGMLAAVSVSDPFGSFQMKTLLNYLERNANSKGESVQESGKGGAGRGLHMIINGSDLVVFNVKATSQTEVIAFFDLDPATKEGTPRQFHFFSE